MARTSQRDALAGKLRRCVTAGIALVGAGVIAVNPEIAATPDVQMPAIQLTAGAQDIVIDIVRHGEDLAPANMRIPFSPEFPGAPLSDLGQQQAQETASQLFGELGGPHGVAGIFSGPDLDAQDTAAPFALLQAIDPQILSGLIEVDGGIFANLPTLSPGGIYYDLAVVSWMLGLVTFLPIPGAAEFNGVVMGDRYTEAIDAIYSATMADPVVSANGQITDVAFSSEASTMIWVMNNVKNPDLSVLVGPLLDGLKNPGAGLPEPLPNAGVVEIQGNPEDGWTLVSWAGQPVPENPGFFTDLFVLWRDLVLPPQVAMDHILEAVVSGDLATIGSALEGGVQGVGAALEQLPQLATNVIADIVAGTW